MVSALSLGLFGNFAAVYSDKPIPTFRANKVQAFLILLACEPKPQRRESLMTMLWPGMPDRSARHNLRQVLYQLRQIIPEVKSTSPSKQSAAVPIILANRQTIQINPQACIEVDIFRFNELISQAQTHDHIDLVFCHICRKTLEEAVALYQGDFLADFYLDDSNEFQDWAETTRHAFRRKALDALETLALIHLRQKNYPQAQSYIERQLDIDNLRENAYRQLMEVLALNGRRVEALSVYETCRQLLADEMGMAPSTQTTALYEKIQAGDLRFDRQPERGVRGYELMEQIGEGAFGSIYRAVQMVIGRDVAIKVIRQRFADDPSFIRRFEAEAQTIARLEHPYIVPLYDYWREPECAFLVMRLYRGGNLLTALEEGPWDLQRTLKLMEQICSALFTAHNQGIVHRDIKPANILFDESGNAYLTDFGIAKDLFHYSRLTLDGRFLGTPDYSSPEQLQNEPLTAAADIYSLGAVLYETLTGERPFPDDSIALRIQKQLTEAMPLVRASRPDLPAEIDIVLQKATAKNPKDRYQDALAMVEAFRQVVQGDTANKSLPLAVPTGVETVNPYKGLRAFQQNDAADFFGREILTQQLLSRLGGSAFLAVVGASGSGKSSLVKAGLIPEIREGALPGSENWFVAEMVPGTNPLHELEMALLPIAVDPPPSLIKPMEKDNRGLLRTIRRILPNEENAHLLLFIDQFEELFTLVEDDHRRQHFIRSLITAMNSPNNPLHVVITLRADFYDRPLQIPQLAKLFKKNTEIILPLSPEELIWAIQEPARQVGVVIEESVVAAMVADVEGQPGALPLLQYALTELFEDRRDNVMTSIGYEDLGGVSGALAQRAEALYAGLDEEGQELSRQLFLRLVTLGEGVEDTRRRVLLSELGAMQTSDVSQTSKVTTILNEFGRHRLMTFDRDPSTRKPTVEVAHEALLREWPRLRTWLDESRADVRLQRLLAAGAAEWAAAGHDPGFLLRGSRLDLYQNWTDDTDLALTGQEQEFLRVSILARRERDAREEARSRQELETAQKLASTEKARAEAEQQRAEVQEKAARRLRRRAYLLTAAIAVAAILAIAAIFFARQSNINTEVAVAQQATAEAEAAFRATAEAQAVADRDIAEEQSRLATSRELAAASIQTIGEDPELSILLALQALNNAHIFEAESALHTAIQNSPLRQTYFHDQPSRANLVTINPNNEQFFASGMGGGVMWDMKDGEVQYTLELPEGDWINEADFTPDGSILIVPHEDWEGFTLVPSPVTLHEAATGEELFGFMTGDDMTQVVQVSPDGRLFATLGSTGGSQPRVWDLEATLANGSGVLVRELCCLADGGQEIAFSPDSGRLAAVAVNRSGALRKLVKVWDLATGENVINLEAAKPGDVAFSPDGSYLATASEGVIEIWDAATGEQVSFAPVDFEAPLSAIHFTPDGEYVVITSRLGVSSLWRFSEGNVEFVKEFRGHRGDTNDSKITADGRHLLTASPWDGTARLWDLDPREAVELGALTQDVFATDAEFIDDGSQLATGNNGGVLKIWELSSGEEVTSIQAHGDAINGLSVSPDGQTIATGTRDDGPIRIWDKDTGALLRNLVGHEIRTSHFFRNVINLQFSPDGQLLASIGADNRIIIWDVQTGERLNTIYGHDGESLAFSPDSRFLVTASWEGTISVWGTQTGEKLLQFSNEQEVPYFSMAISPGGDYVLATRGDKSAELWRLPADLWADEPTQAVLVESFETINSIPSSATFSPDGAKVALSGDRGAIEVRHFPSLDLQLALQSEQNGGCVVFTPDSKGLVNCGEDGTTRFFTVDFDEFLKFAHERLTRELTEEECQRYLHMDSCPAGKSVE